jgi:SnoaL-like domain
MTDMSRDQQIDAMLNEHAITKAIARLARGEDRRDAALISDCFWPEARLDFGVFEGCFADYLAWVVPGADAITNTQHLLGQSHIALAGDAAKVETQVFSYHRIDMGSGGGEVDTVIGGRYLDRFEKRGGDWRIAHRTMLYDWYQDWGPAIDWVQGVMGMPFSAPHFPGRAKGDYSVGFFGG